MRAFTVLTGLVCPLDRANVDTDAIIPKQFLKSILRTGFGPNLFDEWRYADHGEPGMDCNQRPLRSDFVLNQPRYQGAQILLARENFGCGSSREHAPWALEDYGFRVVIAPSFADIFFNNCYKIGLLPIVLPAAVVDALFAQSTAQAGFTLTVDLAAQTVYVPAQDTSENTSAGERTPAQPTSAGNASAGNQEGERWSFDITAHRKRCLLEGLDEIGLTLQHADEIRRFEQARQARFPWMFGETTHPAR